MNVGIYVRVSTEEQRDFGYSIDAQLREIKDYCERRNLNIIDIYNDAGHSAKDLNRPEMERMINDIKNGKINLVISMKVDRLTREGYDGQWFLRFCKDNECGLIFLQENYDVTTPEGEMGYGISLLFGQRERRLISQRTKTAMEEAIKQGKFPGKTPMGYKKNIDKKLEIDLVEAEVIKEVFELYAKGNNASKVASIMSENNRYLRDNGKWTESRITHIINNPIYKGDLLWGRYKRKQNKQILIENHSPAIISEELWDRCQDQLDKNKHGNYGKNIHIFHRVVRCPNCGELMNSYYTIKHQNKKIKYNYYVRCLNKKCDKKGYSYNANKIENELVNILNDLSGIALISSYSLNYPKIDSKKDIDNIKGTITKLKNDENRLLELLLTNKLDEDMLINKMNTLSSERKNLEAKKENLEKGASLNFNKDLVKLYNDKKETDIEGINPIWSLLSREGKKEVIGKFIKYIDISVDDNYNVKIENITFNNEFIQNEFFDIPNYLLEKLKQTYKNIKFVGVFTRNQFNSNLFKDYETYSYNLLMKNYTQDRKSLEVILNKFKDHDLEIALIIENKKYVNAFVMFKITE